MKEKQTVTLKDIMAGVKEEVATAVAPINEKLANLPVAEVKSASNEELKAFNARVVAAEVQAMIDQKNGTMTGTRAKHVETILTERYGKKDPAFVKDFQSRIAEKDLMATGNGGELIIEEYAAGFLDQLWDATVLDKLGVRFLPTQTGNLTISKIVEGLSAGYIGEGGTIDTSTLKFGHIRLSVKKAMALVPISNDLIRYANLNAEALVVDQIIREFAQLMDLTFLYGKGGVFEPQGIITTPDIQKMDGTPKATRDLGFKMVNMLGKENHSLEDLHWVMGWETYEALQLEKTDGGAYVNTDLANGTFVGYPFHVNQKIKKDGDKEDLLLVKASEITGIQGLNLTISNSQEATIQTKDGMLSTFGQDYTLVRAIIENDFRLNYPSAAVVAKIDIKKA